MFIASLKFNGADVVTPFNVTAANLQNLNQFAAEEYRPLPEPNWSSKFSAAARFNIHISFGPLTQAEQINFIALCQKARPHLHFLLGLEPVSQRVSKPIIWFKFTRNNIDNSHGTGLAYEFFIEKFLADALPDAVKQDRQGFIFRAALQSTRHAAVVIGQLTNLMRWSHTTTEKMRLLSRRNISWESFSKMALERKQPVKREHLTLI